MSENVVINDTTYNGVDTVALLRPDGTVVTFYPDAVRYNEQALSEAQKATARQNLGVGSIDEVAAEVLARLQTPVFGRVDADNNIILTGELADGTYTLKYEDAEGNVTEIGTVEVGGMGDNGSIELTWTDNVKLDKSTGVETTSNGEYAASQHIALVDGYTYTFAQSIYGGVNICYYDTNGNGLGYELLWDGVGEVKSKTLTPISGAVTFRVRLYYGLYINLEEVKSQYSLTYEKTA